MSAKVIAMLAKRWGCSTEGVAERIGRLLQRRGLIDADSMKVFEGDYAKNQAALSPPTKWLVLGVTDDDRVAVLDQDDHPIMWLDDKSIES